MTSAGHLALIELRLSSSAEWRFDASGWCFLRVAEGLGYILGTAKKQLGLGEVLVLSGETDAVLRASQLEPLKVDYFRICPELLGGILTLHEQHYLAGAASDKASALRHFPATHNVSRQFGELCGHAQRGDGLLARGSMLQLFVSTFAADLAEPPADPGQRSDAAARFTALIESVAAEEIQRLSIHELASRCGCSERHLSRLFRGYFGISIRARLTEMRLLKAEQLLRGSTAKISQIAGESGFRHIGLFNAMFKRRFGKTPTELRRSGYEPARMTAALPNGLNKPPPHFAGTSECGPGRRRAG
jgi:AraC-like DNA-binding protein